MLQAEVVQVRQVFDLPARRQEVTEHQLMRAQCQCGKVHSGVFPADVVAPVQYGPRVLAAAVYLNQHQMLPQQRSEQSKAANLLGRLREHAQDVWRFASHALVPFTNNAAEQLMRMLKVKLKIAGTFRTEAGADTFCAIRSYLATMVRQGHSAFECLTLVLQGQIPQPRFG